MGWSSGGWGMGLIVAGVLGFFAGPALAQAVDSSGVSQMRVEDIVAQAQTYKLWILLISTLLVLALLFAGGLLTPGGFAKAGLRDVSPMPAVVWLFSGMVVLLAMSSAGAVVSGSGWLQQSSLDDSQRQVIVTLVGFAFGVVAGLGMLFILKRSAPDAGMRLSWLDVPVGFGCFMLAYPVVELMSMAGAGLHRQFSEGMDPPRIAHPILQRLVDNSSDPWAWALVGGAVIGAPFVEELVYRVFLQGALIKITKSPWISIITGGLIFALMHRVGAPEARVPWHALLPIFAIGVACGVGYERTKRVGVPITMHMCFNLLNVLLALLIAPEVATTGV